MYLRFVFFAKDLGYNVMVRLQKNPRTTIFYQIAQAASLAEEKYGRIRFIEYGATK